MKFRFEILVLWLTAFTCLSASAQQTNKKYNSLLWEITGNGLSKPSYLFGTMHISNKMVFHLSDSFYAAIKNAEVVAIELNPEEWQKELPRLTAQESINRHYNSMYYTDFLKQNSFSHSSFVREMQATLRFEPEVNNSLLYRTESRMENFQEDTYLDLYIYQTGKKLGKITTGVETFMGSQRMMIEAYVDAFLEEKKKEKEGNSSRYNNRQVDVGVKLQDAYKRGDLDMLDSLSKVTELSPSFTEKFLYQRNVTQANSMDSIMKHKSLFAGVGAAHLPGNRGVIELLRGKGYKLRPIFMLDRDASQKDLIDTIKVPVSFTTQLVGDSSVQVSAPGTLTVLGQDESIRQYNYADMANGSYYLVTRLPLRRTINGMSDAEILKKIDSLLYENIPGTIITKQKLENGNGMKIVARTKTGNVQRYQINITPFEVIVFKMAAKGSYALGNEAETFFNSIQVNNYPSKWHKYQPEGSGFSTSMPSQVAATYEQNAADGLPAWDYQAFDAKTGDLFSIVKKTIYTYEFIEADSFSTQLILESFLNSKQLDGKKTFKLVNHKGRPVQEVNLVAKNGDHVKARAIVLGPQYYIQVMRSKNKIEASPFFDDFEFSTFKYPASISFIDTNINLKVKSPVYPLLDNDMKEMFAYSEKVKAIENESTYEPILQSKAVNFMSNKTGEVILVSVTKYNKYAAFKDSAAFWPQIFDIDSSLKIIANKPVKRSNGTTGWLTEWADTGSTQILRRISLINGMQLLSAITMVDTTLPESDFVRDFYTSFDFNKTNTEQDLFASKQKVFFKDYFSADTSISKVAKLAVNDVFFKQDAIPELVKGIKQLKPDDKTYYSDKSDLIRAIGGINDSTAEQKVIDELKKIYYSVGDTSMFQNSVLFSLAKLRTKNATNEFKELLLQDPPAFDQAISYESLFSVFRDTLPLAVHLFPEILNLSNIEDYKVPIRTLLASLVDSNLIKPEQYEDYVGNIFFDAKIAAKKIQLAQTFNQNENESDYYSDKLSDIGRSMFNANYKSGYSGVVSATMGNQGANVIDFYLTLLAPFYKKNPNIAGFLNKQLTVGNTLARATTALAFLKNGYPVDKEVWVSLFNQKGWQLGLYDRLATLKKLSVLKEQSLKGESVAAMPIYDRLNNQIDSLQFFNASDVTEGKGEKEQAYFYKYRVKNDNTWRLAIGFTKADKSQVIMPLTSETKITQTSIPSSEKELENLKLKTLKRIKIEQHSAGIRFYDDESADEDSGLDDYTGGL